MIYTMLPDWFRMMQDEVKGGEEAIALDVEGYSVHTPEPPADWLVALPLLGLPGSGEPLPKVSPCFDWLQT